MRVIFSASLIWLAAALPATADFSVGLSVGDVTPSSADAAGQEYYMGGYGLWTGRGAATGAHDRLSSRAFCIEGSNGDAGAFCLAVVDSLGIPGPMVQEIKTVASFQTGLPESRILVAATHTHAAPDLLGLWGGSPESYRRMITRETANLITNAWRGRMPSRVFHAATRFEAHNRRDWNEIDDELHVLFVRDPADEVTLAVLVNAGVHPTVTPGRNLEFSSDFVHTLRDRLAAEFEAPVIFVNGTLGDVIPPPLAEGDDYWQAAEDYGERLFRRTLDAFASRVETGDEIIFEQETARLPVDNLVLGMAQFFGLLEGSVVGPPWSQSVTSTVSLIRIGDDVSIVTLPGEPVTKFGKALKSQMPGSHRMVLGQVDDSLGYIIPSAEWETGRNGNYEESVSLGPETAQLLEQVFRSLLSR